MAIVAVALGTAFAMTLAANAHFGSNPAATALDEAVSARIRTARDLLKYRGATLQPSVVQTTVPMPDGSPLPAQLQLQATAVAGGAASIAVSATATWLGKTLTVTRSATIAAGAPLPGTSVALPGLAPAPTGAP